MVVARGRDRRNRVKNTGDLLPSACLLRVFIFAVVLLAATSPVLAEEPVFTFGGNADWFAQAAVTHDQVEAYQSGAITHNQSTWMETTFTGPGAVRFWWKVSSEPCCDRLQLMLDGNQQADIRGDVGWQRRAVAIPSGTHTLRWTYSTDGSSLSGANAGWVDEVIFEPGTGIDVTPPVTTATPAGGAIYATAQNVTLSCSDNVGCSGTFYCLGNGCDPVTSYSGPITISSTNILRFYSLDSAGNYGAVNSAIFTFDTTPPTTHGYPSSGSYEGARTVSLYCSDSGMGCGTTYYCLGSGCSPSIPYASPITINASTDLRYTSTDRGGNAEPIRTSTYTIIPDTTPPVTNTSYPSGTYGPTYVYLWCSDGNGSGCNRTLYCLGTGCTPDTTYTTSIRISASAELRFYSEDRSGNRESVQTVSYTIDNIPPVTTVTPPGGSYESAPSVTLSCRDDNGTGCSGTYYCKGENCSPSMYYTGPIAINENTVLRFYSTDSGSNRESVTTQYYVNPASQRTRNVPGVYSTIQSAIDVSYNGDSVLVAPGTYVENINYRGKNITVTSSDRPEVTIIDGNRAGPVVTFNSGETRSAILRGFTIRNGLSPEGGGVYIDRAAPTLTNNTIMSNSASSGAGISVYFGSPLISNNAVTLNSSSSYGGGIHLGGAASTEIVGNVISGNRSSSGGGISMWSAGTAVLLGNTIKENTASGDGGGISIINGNSARIVQNLIANNKAYRGGGIYGGAQTDTFVNNTISGNDSTNGAGVYVPYSTFRNNIVVSKAGQAGISRSPSYLSNFTHNLVYAPSGDAYVDAADQNGINGNVTADPRFSGPSLGYFGLQAGSPAIDAGDLSESPLLSTDLNERPRILDGNGRGVAQIDMGAYEFDPAEPRALLTGVPADATEETSATITVGGTGIVTYRYSLDGAPFSTVDTPVTTQIVLTGLAGGRHTVAVLGKTSSREQTTSSATVAEWLVDNIPPVTTATPGSGTYTGIQSVTLTCDDNSGSGCAGTYYCLGGDCTPDTAYTGAVPVDSSAGMRFFSVDAFGNREATKTASYVFVGTIAGRITDGGTGEGISGAYITAYDAATGAAITWSGTDSSGNYRLIGLRSGNYKLNVVRTGYVNQWYNGKSDRSAATAVAVSAPGETAGINVALVTGGRITGTVTDKDTGAGVQGVFVTIYDVAAGLWSSAAPTDASGAYTVTGLATGRYKLRFESYAMGYLTQWYNGKTELSSATELIVTAGSTTSGIDVVLARGGSISGRVTDGVPAGNPVAGVEVSVYDAGTGSWIRSGITDSSGNYRIPGLSGTYKLQFSGSGYIRQWYSGKTDRGAADTVTVSAPNETAGVNVSLLYGGRITGTVTDRETGIGIRSAYVVAYNAVSKSWVNSGNTDGTGAYFISGLPAGDYKLYFSSSGYVDQWSGGKPDEKSAAAVTVTAAGITPGIDMALVRGAEITGTVTGKGTGTGIPGVYVSAYNVNTDTWAGSAVTNGVGNYHITGLSSGSYKLSFSSTNAEGYLDQWYSNKAQKNEANVVETVAPNAVTGIDVILERGGIVMGTVTDSESGSAISGAYVIAYNATTGTFVNSTSTDSSGAYTLSRVPTGNYKISFSRSGYVTQWYDTKTDRRDAKPVGVTAPETVSGVNVAMVKGGSISGTIYDRITGAGIMGISVYLIDRSTGAWAGSDYTNEDGTYSITDLASGTYRVRIDARSSTGYIGGWYGSHEGAYACADTVSVIAPDATLGIDAGLSRGGSISGRVTDADTGFGVSGLSVSLTKTGTAVMSMASATVDATGAYTIGGLESGEYSLLFSAPDYMRSAAPTVATVTAPGATTGVDVSLARGGGISGRVVFSDTGEGVEGVLVEAMDVATGRPAGSAMSGYGGEYVVRGLPSGNYSLFYDGRDIGGSSGWSSVGTGISSTGTGVLSSSAGVSTSSAVETVPEVISKRTAKEVAVPSAGSVSVTAPGVTAGVDFSIERLGGIAGRVSETASGNPVDWVSVTAYDGITGAWAGSTVTNDDGTYRIGGLSSGSYRVYFSSSLRDGGYLSTWYGSSGVSVMASEVEVHAPETTSGVDAQLAKGGGIAGAISLTSCPGARSINIRAYGAGNGVLYGQTWVNTEYTDYFEIPSLPAGAYKIAVIPENGFIRQWYPGTSDAATAESITVTPGNVTSGVEVSISAGGGSVSGKVARVLFTHGSEIINLYDWYSGGLAAETTVAPNGEFQLTGLRDGSYKLAYSVNFVERWYRRAGETAQASPIVVSGGIAVTGVDLTETWGPDGDLDGSGGPPGLIDALTALRVVVGLAEVTPEILAHGDLAPLVDGVSVPDGRIEISDALLILQKVVSATMSPLPRN